MVTVFTDDELKTLRNPEMLALERFGHKQRKLFWLAHRNRLLSYLSGYGSWPRVLLPNLCGHCRYRLDEEEYAESARSASRTCSIL